MFSLHLWPNRAPAAAGYQPKGFRSSGHTTFYCHLRVQPQHTEQWPPDPSHRVPVRDTGLQQETSFQTRFLCSPGCEWLRAGSQGHQGCLTRREVAHGQGFAWAAHRTQQVPSFWRKSLLWRTDTTCLFTLDGICWHFLCAKALISEQSREGRERALGDLEVANTSAGLDPGTGLAWDHLWEQSPGDSNSGVWLLSVPLKQK